jgi:hypothetical protein
MVLTVHTNYIPERRMKASVPVPETHLGIDSIDLALSGLQRSARVHAAPGPGSLTPTKELAATTFAGTNEMTSTRPV